MDTRASTRRTRAKVAAAILVTMTAALGIRRHSHGAVDQFGGA